MERSYLIGSIDISRSILKNRRMDARTTSRIVAVDRLNDALVISFSDNRCAMFSADFLYDAISQVKELEEDGPAEQPVTIFNGVCQHF